METDILKKKIMLETRNLSFSYNNTKTLNDVNFRAYEGQLVAVIGPNGAGKSTLFKCILNFLKNYEGEILLEGRNIKEMSRKEISKYIAYIPQTTVPVFNYDVLDIVLMGATSSLKPLESPGKRHKEKAYELLKSMGIEHLAGRGFGNISGGERQMVLLARAINQDAKILVMDEPTANLDYGNQFRVMMKIRELVSSGFTVIISTHNPEHALLFAEKAFVLSNGEVVTAGPSKEVMTKELMAKLYGVKVEFVETDFEGKKTFTCIPVAEC